MRLLAILLATLLTGCSGLGFLQNPATDTTQYENLMRLQNVRGCTYLRMSAAPWASVTSLTVATWGANPPSYEECWRGLPAGMP